MRRITKLGSLTLALLLTVPGLLVLDLFSGAGAAADAPLLFSHPMADPVGLVAVAQEDLADDAVAVAFVRQAEDGDVLEVRLRSEAAPLLFRHTAGQGEAPWRFAQLALTRDGRSLAAAGEDGRILYVNSVSEAFDSPAVFRAGSPVTALDFDATGTFLAAATYHGDLFLFARQHFLAHGTYALHIPAPIPAGALPGGVVDDAGAVEDLLGDARGAARALQDEAPLALRPWSHVTLFGVPRTASDAQGLFLAAGTAFGELYAYDLSRLHAATEAATLEPFVTRLGDAPCQQVSTPQGDVELPCSHAALDRFLTRYAGGVPADVGRAVSRAVAEAVPLDRLLSPVPGEDASLFAGLRGTRGTAEAGAQLLVAALGDGAVEAFRVRPASASAVHASPPAAERLWRLDVAPGIEALDLSPFHTEATMRAASLALATSDGTLRLLRVPIDGPAAPPVHLETTIQGGAAQRIDHVAIAGAAPGETEAVDAGRYVLVVLQDGELRLYQARDREPGTAPGLLWAGRLPFGGAVGAVALQDHGGVVASARGVAVYANLASVWIDASSRIDRHQPWRAEARVEAPDTGVREITWQVEPLETTAATGAVARPGAVFEHAFTTEGTYRVRLRVVDEKGIEIERVRELVVGGRNPILAVSAPASMAVGEQALFSFAGTHDPNLPPGSGHGITRIEVHPYGDARQDLADLDDMSYRFHAEGPTGLYRPVVVAYDAEGRSTRSTLSLTVTAPGFTLLGEAGGSIRLTGIAAARDSGHTVAFGGNLQGDRSRLEVRAPDGSMLIQEGTGQQGDSSSAYTSAAITPDGSFFAAGRRDGSAVRVPVADPEARVSFQVFDGAAVRWTFVSADGEQLLFVAEDGRFAAAPGNLSAITHRHALGGAPVQVAADERLIHVAAVTGDGALVVLDGHRPDHGVRDSHAPAAGVTALAMTPNLDPMGRGWVFMGLEDGRVESLRVLVHELSPIGVASYDGDGLPIHAIAPGRVDERSRYALAAVSSNPRIDCQPGSTNPCGSLFYTHSRGPSVGGVPVPAREAELDLRPSVLLMDADARRFLVASVGRDPFVVTYDTLWDDGPLSRLSGFGARITTGVVSSGAAAHLVTESGRVAWIFAPPRASIGVGPHDAQGEPAWGERVHAHQEVTISGLNSSAGHGTIVSYRWDLGGNETSDSPSPTHEWSERGWHTVRLTVTSRITTPVETLVTDRALVEVPVFDPPPVARLAATPFDADAGAVRITSGDEVRFDASASAHPTGARLVDYRFSTGTGFATNKGSPTFAFSYPNPGVYNATVRVTDEQGSVATSAPVRVEVANRPPAADFSFGQAGADLPAGRVFAHRDAAFEGGDAVDPDGRVVAWEWQFPGGVPRTGKSVEHTFRATGDQTVRLRVQDDWGTWSAWTERVVQVEKGIRVTAEQDPPDGATVGPTERVRVAGLAHDLRDAPSNGEPVAGATVTVRVFFDGFSSNPAATPYETKSYETDDDGWMTHNVAFNQGVAYQPGKYRVELVGKTTGVYGDTVTSAKTITSFWVDA